MGQITPNRTIADAILGYFAPFVKFRWGNRAHADRGALIQFRSRSTGLAPALLRSPHSGRLSPNRENRPATARNPTPPSVANHPAWLARRLGWRLFTGLHRQQLAPLVGHYRIDAQRRGDGVIQLAAYRVLVRGGEEEELFAP